MKWKPPFFASWEHSVPGLWGTQWTNSSVLATIKKNCEERWDRQYLEGNETVNLK